MARTFFLFWVVISSIGTYCRAGISKASTELSVAIFVTHVHAVFTMLERCSGVAAAATAGQAAVAWERRRVVAHRHGGAQAWCTGARAATHQVGELPRDCLSQVARK